LQPIEKKALVGWGGVKKSTGLAFLLWSFFLKDLFFYKYS